MEEESFVDGFKSFLDDLLKRPIISAVFVLAIFVISILVWVNLIAPNMTSVFGSTPTSEQTETKKLRKSR
jgi:hypothetical protein